MVANDDGLIPIDVVSMVIILFYGASIALLSKMIQSSLAISGKCPLHSTFPHLKHVPRCVCNHVRQKRNAAGLCVDSCQVATRDLFVCLAPSPSASVRCFVAMLQWVFLPRQNQMDSESQRQRGRAIPFSLLLNLMRLQHRCLHHLALV